MKCIYLIMFVYIILSSGESLQYSTLRILSGTLRLLEKLNSMAFSIQANYTDRATAACRRS
jgi:hypothetical protein